MKTKIKRHFQLTDPILFSILDKVDSIAVQAASDMFADLIETIVNQQLSEKAGATIFTRFKKLFPKGNITATGVLRLPDKTIRNVGPSWSKVTYIKNIALAVKTKKLDLKKLHELTDEEVIKELTQIKGIGRWTAEMFLMFSLGRADIFSYGDLGLRRAIQKLYKFKKEPTIKQMEKITSRWKPYRTYAARILWRSLEI